MAASSSAHIDRRSFLTARESGDAPGKEHASVRGAPEEESPELAEERAERPPRRFARTLRRSIGILLVTTAAALLLTTQTAFGRSVAADMMRRALAANIDGEVRVGTVLGGNVFTRMSLAGFAILDAESEVLVAIDTVVLEYSPLALASGRLHIRRLTAAGLDLQLTQKPDGSWNHERIFDPSGAVSMRTLPAQPPSGEEDGAPRILITDATVTSGRIRIRAPWTAQLEGAAKDRALREVRSGEFPWATAETPEGEFERLYELAGFSGTLPFVRVDAPGLPFAARLDEVGGTLRIVSQPLEVSRLDMTVTLADTARFAVDRLETGRSVLSGEGWVEAASAPEFAFEVDAEALDVEDLRWIPVKLPEEGSGPARIDVYSRSEDLSANGGGSTGDGGPPNDGTVVVTVSDTDFRSGDSRLQGGFSLAIRQRPHFDTLALDLDLRVGSLADFVGREAAVDGRVQGSVRGAGYPDDLTVDAELAFQELIPDGPGASPSGLRVRGGVRAQAPLAVRGLEVDFDSFDPGWLRLAGVGAGAKIGGRLGGSLAIDRPEGGEIAFSGAVTHFRPRLQPEGGPPQREDTLAQPADGFPQPDDGLALSRPGTLSLVAGYGSVDIDGSRIEASIDVAPLSLGLLRPWLPEIEPTGAVSGRLIASGTLDALAVSADVAAESGDLSLDGEFDFASETVRYDAEIVTTGLSTRQWVEGAPDSRLTMSGRLAGAGLGRETRLDTLRLEIGPSGFERAEVYDGHATVRVVDGLATIDSLLIYTDVGTISVRGDFGLYEGRRGEADFDASVTNLWEWNRWFAPAGTADGSPVSYAEEETTQDMPDPPGPIATTGRLAARGQVAGSLDDFTVDVLLDASDAGFRGYMADSLTARIRLLDAPRLEPAVWEVAATGASIGVASFDSLSIDLDGSEAASASLAFAAHRDSTLAIEGSAALAGGWDAELSSLRIRLGKLESELENPARLAYSDTGFVASDFNLEGTLGRIHADGRIPAAGDGDLRLELFGVRVDQLGYLFSESPEVGGTLGGSARMTGTLSAPRFNGALNVIDPSVRDQRYGELATRFDYSDRRLDGAVELFLEGEPLGRLEGSVAADLALAPVERRLLDSPFDLRAEGERLPLALAEVFVSGMEAITGTVAADLAIQGSPGDLRYDGHLEMYGGTAWAPDLGIWLDGAGARIAFEGSSLAGIDSLCADSRLGGRACASGTIDIASLANAAFDLDIVATDFHAVSRRDMSLAVGGHARLEGSYAAPRITAPDVALAEGDLRQEEFLRARSVVDLSDPAVYSMLDSAVAVERRILEQFRNPFMENLVIDANVSLGPNLWLRSPQLDVEVVSDGLAVRAGPDSVNVTGEVELPRGTYRFDRVPPYVQSLRITGGSIRFSGEPDFNPDIDITAEYRDRTPEGPVVVEAHIRGTPRESRLELTSNPPMSETDQLCLLAIGAPCYRSTDQQLGGRLIHETLVGTLSSGISSVLVGTAGLSYFSVTSIGGAGAQGVVGNRSVFDRTAVEFGWYPGDELFLSYWQPLGGGPPRAAVEWSFLPNWTVEARTASRFDERLFGLSWGTNLANQRMFELLLFREWSSGG